jgi:hypothetical protein
VLLHWRLVCLSINRILEKSLSISDCTGNLSHLSEPFWLFLRSVSRTILEIPVHFPTDQPQKIPFWTGYNSSLSFLSSPD